MSDSLYCIALKCYNILFGMDSWIHIWFFLSMKARKKKIIIDFDTVEISLVFEFIALTYKQNQRERKKVCPSQVGKKNRKTKT